MKRGAGARRLSLMKERSQISSKSYEWKGGGGEHRHRSFVDILSGLTDLEKRRAVLVRWENEAQRFLLH